MKKLILTLLLILIPGSLLASEAGSRPHWSFELKGGAFFPDAAQWSTFYNDSYTGEYGAALSYKVQRQLEVGLEGSYARAKGRGQLRQSITGEVTHEQVPLNLFLLTRGVFSEEQWLVPYAGGGYTRLFYRQRVKGQGTTEGSENGYHARAGLQLLLDRLEPGSAESAYRDFGLHNSYFFVEGRYSNVEVDTLPSGSVNLGGTSVLGGVLMEF